MHMKIESPIEKSHTFLEPWSSRNSPSSIWLPIKIWLNSHISRNSLNTLWGEFLDVIEQEFGHNHLIINLILI